MTFGVSRRLCVLTVGCALVFSLTCGCQKAEPPGLSAADKQRAAIETQGQIERIEKDPNIPTEQKQKLIQEAKGRLESTLNPPKPVTQ